MFPQLNDFLEQSGMSLPESLVKGSRKASETVPVEKVEIASKKTTDKKAGDSA